MSGKFSDVFNVIKNNPLYILVPLDEEIIERMPLEFEMHDSIIIATAKYVEEVGHESVLVLTKDREIKSSGLIKVNW